MSRTNKALTDEQRDYILVQSLIYRKSQSQISKETGISQSVISANLAFYWALNDENWEKLAQIYAGYYAGRDTQPEDSSLLNWAANANRKKIPADVLDELRPKKSEAALPNVPVIVKTEPTSDSTSVDKIAEQNEQILACLRALVDGMPQILTAIQYLDKLIKDEFTGNFDPLMGTVKNINENLVGVKCNTRYLKYLEGNR